MIEGADYFVRYTKFPANTGVHGMVLLNDDGTYSIYIDKNATMEQQEASLEHELEHIANDDMHGEKTIFEVEKNLSLEKEASQIPEEKEIPQPLDWFSSWQRTMQLVAEEMRKQGIKPGVYLG